MRFPSRMRFSERTGRTAYGPTRGQLQSFGDHVLIRRGLRVKWIEFSEATGGRSCGSCSREEVGRFDRSRFAVGVHGGCRGPDYARAIVNSGLAKLNTA